MERLKKNGKNTPDALYISHNESHGSDRNFFLLTGIDSGSFIYSSVVVTRDGTPHLFVQELEEEEVKPTGLPYTLIRPGEKTVLRALKGHSVVGVNAEVLTLAEAGRLKDHKYALVNIGPDLEEARAIKTEPELAHLRKASEIAAQTAHDIPKMVKADMTEKELCARIDYKMASLGSDGIAFDTIVAFGERSAIPHATPSDRKLKKGEFILCDFGALSGKMRSDITRTFVFGAASEGQKALYHAVLKIQKHAFSRLKSGVNGRELHADADAAILEFFRRKKAPAGKMGHSLGHSIGLYSHDGKRLSLATDYILPHHFITTVEPGGYLPGFGGVRIEDMALVTRQGAENLTEKAPKNELIEIT
ncbi:MAG: hypothetical protein A2293_00440 [Elusimicrobia bacterium RIFOXYB2_FULL_49_7]|nr:MAG: hypothetical protein A2293_00440 [Elusimicrobia bacterium RIFOXYB2_FULL_49_7]